MSFPTGVNSANYGGYAKWPIGNSVGNITSVGTNGGPSAYGTEDQCGNVWEWNEKDYGGNNKGIMGGAFNTTNITVPVQLSLPESISISGISYHSISTQSSRVGIRLVSQDPSSSFAGFVGIGDTGNIADPRTSFGNVNYTYNIMVHPVTNSQYIQFLNVIDPSGQNTYSLYPNTPASSSPHRGISINMSAITGMRYSIITNFADKPVNFVSYRACAMLCNWLHNGQSANPETLFSGVYDIVENSIGNRSPSYKYAIPTADEWYKAAFYNPNNETYYTYATQSNNPPCAVNSTGCDITVNNIGIGSDAVVQISPTPTPTNTITPTITPTPTITVTSTNTPTPTQTTNLTPTPTNTTTPTITITPTISITPSISITPTQTPTNSVTPTISITPSITTTPTNTPTITPTKTVTKTPTPTPTTTPTVTPTITPTPSITPTKSLTPSVDISRIQNGIISNKYSILEYPLDRDPINLFGVEAESILDQVDSIFTTNSNSDKLLYFNTLISSTGNKHIPNSASTLKTIEPGNTYYIVTKNNAQLPIVIPGFDKTDYIGKYIPLLVVNSIIEDLEELSTEIETKKLLEDAQLTEISWAKLINVMYADVKYYFTRNKNIANKLANILYTLQEYFTKYSTEELGMIAGIDKYCDSIQINEYIWHSLYNSINLDPTILIDSNNNGSIKYELSDTSSNIIPINIEISGFNRQPGTIMTYELKLLDSSEECLLYPLSGTLLLDNSGSSSIKPILIFCENNDCSEVI